MFMINPTLSVKLTNNYYALTYDMYKTFFFKDKGIIYAVILGRDGSGKNFDNFSTAQAKETLGVSGILLSPDGSMLTFPLPKTI